MAEKKRRSIAKAVTWRMTGTMGTMLVVFVATRDISLTIQVGAVEVILKSALYFIHERIWNTIPWGKTENT